MRQRPDAGCREVFPHPRTAIARVAGASVGFSPGRSDVAFARPHRRGPFRGLRSPRRPGPQ
ncbi:protein of unknown function [Agreia sp. COWG]|nr:protein of unknown function [Agreia sp. COWG]